MTAVGEGELLTRIDVPPSSGAGDGFAGVTIGAHGTYIVNAAATVAGDAARVAIGCVAASPVRATAMEERLGGDFSEDAVRAAAEGLGASLDPPSDVHGSADYRRHLAEVSAVRAVLQAAGTEEVVSAPVTSRTVSVEVNGEQIELRGADAPAPRPLHPRRPRPHRNAHRLRHRQLRRVHGARGRRGREELHDARGPGRRDEDRDGRGARRPTAS